MVDFEDFKLEAANDNYDKSIEAFENYDELAAAVVEHIGAIYSSPQDYPVQETIHSVIHRTNSISALQLLQRRIEDRSLINLVENYISELLKPIASTDISQYQREPSIEMCAEGVLCETLSLLLLNVNSSSFDALAERWRIPARNYLDPRKMRESVRKNRNVILGQVARLEGLFDMTRRESNNRLSVLSQVKT